MAEGKFTAQGSLELPGDHPRPAAPPIPEEKCQETADLALFARAGNEEPIISVKRLDRCLALAVRDPGVHKITVEMTPAAARDLAGRLLDAAREFER